MRWVLGILVGLAVGIAPARPVLKVANTEEVGVSAPEARPRASQDASCARPSVAQRSSEQQIDLNTIHAEVTDWKFDAAFDLPEIPEPSGLCYCELTGTIFVVDDGGTDRPAGLHEINLDGNYLRGTTFGADLEGVTYCGANQLLYVCDEADERVHIVEPKTLAVQGSFQVSRICGNDELTAGGNGFEGIAWMDANQRPDIFGEDNPKLGYLVLLNQDDPTAIVAAQVNECIAGRTVEPAIITLLPQRNSGELWIDMPKGEMWVVNSWLNTMAVVDLTDTEYPDDESGISRVKRYEVLPGMAQEGLTFDPQGRMWIGQDIGGVVRYVKGG